MGDQPTNGTTNGTNGQPSALDLARMRDQGRLAFEEAFRSGELAEKPAAETAPPAEAPKAAAAAPAKVEAKKPAEEPADDFGDDDDDDTATPDDFADEDDDKAPDAETRRRMERLQRQEAHAREQLARERADFERAKAEHAARLEKAERLEKRSKHEVVELLEEMGLDEEDWGTLAKRAHARSKDGKADPKWKELADREASTRRTSDDVKSLRAEIDALKKAAEKRDVEERTDRQLSRYFDEAKKLASDDSPLFKRHLSADPDEAHADLQALAREGLEKTGKLVPQKKLISIYERRRARFLAKFGVDVDALLGKKTTKEQSLAAAKEHAATTTSTTTAATSANGAGSTDRRALRASFESSKDVD